MTKTALVTGSAGFIGRHMVRELDARGYQIFKSDIQPSTVAQGALDIFNRFGHKYDEGRFDLVVHCAFHVGGRAAIDGVNTNFLKNLQLDSAMFEWAVRTKQKRVLYFSSSAAYPVEYQTEYCIECGFDNCQDVGFPLREDMIDLSEPKMPDANYGWAKLTGERMAEDARRSGLAVTVVRPASGCGATQSPDYPWPSIIKRAMSGDLSVWGNPDSVRDFIDVSDVINGALAVVDSGTTNPVNLGTGIGTSMRQLATLAFEVANPGQPVPEVVSVPGAEGVFYRVLDPTRLHQHYVPVKSVEEMVRETVQALRASAA